MTNVLAIWQDMVVGALVDHSEVKGQAVSAYSGGPRGKASPARLQSIPLATQGAKLACNIARKIQKKIHPQSLQEDQHPPTHPPN